MATWASIYRVSPLGVTTPVWQSAVPQVTLRPRTYCLSFDGGLMMIIEDATNGCRLLREDPTVPWDMTYYGPPGASALPANWSEVRTIYAPGADGPNWMVRLERVLVMGGFWGTSDPTTGANVPVGGVVPGHAIYKMAPPFYDLEKIYAEDYVRGVASRERTKVSDYALVTAVPDEAPEVLEGLYGSG